MTHADVKRVTDNKNTRVLIEWLDTMIKYSNKYIVSPQFFHKSHSPKDRTIIVHLIKEFFTGIESVEVIGNGITITLKTK